MAENLTIARPYAKAIFLDGVENGSLNDWSAMLKVLLQIYNDEAIRSYVDNCTNKDIVEKVFLDLTDGIINDACKNFIKVLAENKRLCVLPEIYIEFERLKNEHDKVLDVQCISARELSNDDELALVSKLEKKYSCKVRLKKIIDPTIIGGAIVKIGCQVIDASVKTRIQDLSSTLR